MKKYGAEFSLTPVLNWKRAYDENASVIYLLDRELKIARCNPAWDRFALSNRGQSAVSSKVLGACVMDAVPPELRDFYLTAYNNVQRYQRDWWHAFECSSAARFRVYQMRILPCDEGSLLIINTLISDGPAPDAPHRDVADYTLSDGVATTCSHCRRVKSVRLPISWD